VNRRCGLLALLGHAAALERLRRQPGPEDDSVRRRVARGNAERERIAADGLSRGAARRELRCEGARHEGGADAGQESPAAEHAEGWCRLADDLHAFSCSARERRT